jgi:hypothetical protein
MLWVESGRLEERTASKEFPQLSESNSPTTFPSHRMESTTTASSQTLPSRLGAALLEFDPLKTRLKWELGACALRSTTTACSPAKDSNKLSRFEHERHCVLEQWYGVQHVYFDADRLHVCL